MRMLIDASHAEETRVVVLNGNRLEEFDFESSTKQQLKGNIYLAKVTRVEPSLQAAFIEYGGNRHGFLAFNEIHPDYYQIPVEDRRALLAEEAESAAEDAEREEAEVARQNRRRRAKKQRAKAEAADSEAEETEDEDALVEEAPADDETAEAAAGEAAGDDVDASDETVGTDEDTAAEAAAADDTPIDVSADDDPEDDGSDDKGAIPARASGGDSVSEEIAEPGAVEASSDETSEPAADADDAEAPDAEGVSDPAVEDDAETGEETVEAADDAAEEDTDAEADDAGDGDEAPADTDGREAAELDAGDDEAEKNASASNGDAFDEVPRRKPRPRRHYKIQEVIKKNQILLIQVVKEERGNKGAALTTYLSLAGRYCVLMPNTARGGGISRKITNQTARRKLKTIVSDLEVPEGMGVIVRTAGSNRTKSEIRRDFDYLMRLWDSVRNMTLESTAPCLVYEEANLIKRAIRDLYTKDVEEILVEGDEGYRTAKDFMRMLLPSHAKKVQPYKDRIPLFHRYQVDQQLDSMHSNTVQLRSGGYLVINPTEALVAIDVNSGRSTRERNIEETATKTNLEAADEVARQLRLRDLAGLIVIDFIDMEENRNVRAVERRLKDAVKNDRARIQIGRISMFGLMEMSRQRLRPSFVEASTVTCTVCHGTGVVRSTESTALHVIRAIEEEALRNRAAELTVFVPTQVALYLLNQKRFVLNDIESHHQLTVMVEGDDSLTPPNYRLEITEAREGDGAGTVVVPETTAPANQQARGDEDGDGKKKRRRRRRRRKSDEDQTAAEDGAPRQAESEADGTGEDAAEDAAAGGNGEEEERGRRRRRRGRRGGRRQRESAETTANGEAGKAAEAAEAPADDAPEVVHIPIATGEQDSGVTDSQPVEVAATDETETAPQPADADDVTADAAPLEDAPVAPETAPVEADTPETATAAEPEEASDAAPAEAEAESGEDIADDDASDDAETAESDDEPVEEATETVAQAAAEPVDKPVVDESAAPVEGGPKRSGWWQRRFFTG